MTVKMRSFCVSAERLKAVLHNYQSDTCDN